MNRASLLILCGILGASLVPVACGDSEGTGGAGGTGTTTSATSVSVTKGGATVTANTTGMPPVCDGSAWGATCGTCLEAECCQELADSMSAWSEDLQSCAQSCANECSVDFLGAECSAPTTLPARGACVTSTANQCNPVTQEGCNLANGEACDLSNAGFVCYPDGNVHTQCESCGQSGEYCVGGYACYATCAKYCCDDSDCGPGTCKKGIFFIEPNLGLCETDGNEGGGGGGGAGPGGGGGGGSGPGGAGGAGPGGAGGAGGT